LDERGSRDSPATTTCGGGSDGSRGVIFFLLACFDLTCSFLVKWVVGLFYRFSEFCILGREALSNVQDTSWALFFFYRFLYS
jgi:hypothetical protein